MVFWHKIKQFTFKLPLLLHVSFFTLERTCKETILSVCLENICCESPFQKKRLEEFKLFKLNVKYTFAYENQENKANNAFIGF